MNRFLLKSYEKLDYLEISIKSKTRIDDMSYM